MLLLFFLSSGNYSSTDDAEVTDTVQSSNHQHFSHQGVITIHGLIPYSATEQEIADYLQDYNVQDKLFLE